MIVERAIVVVLRIEAPTQDAANAAFDDLRTRVTFTLPKLRFGAVRVLSRDVSLRTVSVRGTIGKAPDA